MADATTDDNEFGKELAAAWETDEKGEAPEPPVVEPEKKPDDPTDLKEEPNPDDPNKQKEEPQTPPADPEKKPEDENKAPEVPVTPEEPKPLTKDDLRTFMNEVRTEERTSGQEIEKATNEVLEAYYPEGLSDTLVDEASGKELKTPQDVVDASGGNMSIEDATQWLMNEQFKLNQNIAKIKDDARAIAEVTTNFTRDSTAVLQRYEPLFKSYPQIQQKVWDQYKKLMKVDETKGVILSAPDIQEFYDFHLEPYRLAFEHSQQQGATNPPAPTQGAPAPPPPATPGVNDRLDDSGDGGQSPVDDPNDFAQQVVKELSKGF